MTAATLQSAAPALLWSPAAVLAAIGKACRSMLVAAGAILAMVGFAPNEGEDVMANLVFRNTDVDRGASLEMLLFTNVAPGETITEATLTEPVGTGYARITLADASWSAGSPATYAEQTFTAGAGGWTGSVQGYAIVTTGTTPRILVIEVDANGPYTFNENDTYKITASNTYD